jgi:hypothetical protein
MPYDKDKFRQYTVLLTQRQNEDVNDLRLRPEQNMNQWIRTAINEKIERDVRSRKKQLTPELVS